MTESTKTVAEINPKAIERTRNLPVYVPDVDIIEGKEKIIDIQRGGAVGY